jgi:hypothetical protein
MANNVRLMPGFKFCETETPFFLKVGSTMIVQKREGLIRLETAFDGRLRCAVRHGGDNKFMVPGFPEFQSAAHCTSLATFMGTLLGVTFLLVGETENQVAFKVKSVND